LCIDHSKCIALLTSIQALAKVKSYAKAGSKYPQKKNQLVPQRPNDSPRLFSTSPFFSASLLLGSVSSGHLRHLQQPKYSTISILNNPEPDPSQAIAIGAEDPDVGAGVNAAAEELLRSLPGISAKNVKHVMSKVRSVRELCEMGREGVQEILRMEPENPAGSSWIEAN